MENIENGAFRKRWPHAGADDHDFHERVFRQT